MALIADGLLIATALTAALYCAILSRRLRRLANADEGLGARIKALHEAVEETRAALAETQEKAAVLRGQSGAAGERLKRESAEARHVADTLAETVAGARRLIDDLYRAETPREAAPSGLRARGLVETPEPKADAFEALAPEPEPADAVASELADVSAPEAVDAAAPTPVVAPPARARAPVEAPAAPPDPVPASDRRLLRMGRIAL